MSATRWTGVEGEISRLKKGILEFEKEAVTVMRDATILVLKELFSNTPVWSGETVRNYAVGLGRMPAGGTRSPLGSGPPGDTNNMPLGTEPRRPDNESASLSEAAAVLSTMTKLQSVFVTNTVDGAKWDLVDSGSAPDKNRSRNPGGVSKLAEVNARAALSAYFR